MTFKKTTDTEQAIEPNDHAHTEQTPDAEPLKALSHPSYEELEQRLNEVEEQLNLANSNLADQQSQLLRSHAELDNIRKRAEKDITNAHKYGLDRLINELLPVIDSMERGLGIEINENEFAQNMHAGLEMTLTLLLGVLEKFSVKVVNPLYEQFDPALHQAISAQADANSDPNTVLQVLQKGYVLHDRLIRPALVVVSK